VASGKVYDFSMDKVEGSLVSFLKKSRNEATVADMIAGTGLPKYQVEQGIKTALDEYAGRLRVTESGEILYSFPSGMRSTKKGFGPAFKRFIKAFARVSARVLSFLFKIWIVVMLIGYFVIFLALIVLAIVASFAASAAGGKGRDSRSSSRRGGGFGGTFMVIRLFDLLLRMWFYSSILNSFQGGTRQKKPVGRPFYKSVFGFAFGEGDANPEWEEREKMRVISYIRAKRGVITLEELMALTGRDNDEAQTLVNRYLLEFEGEPAVTEKGTLIFIFPELLRTTEGEQKTFMPVSLQDPLVKNTAPFSANKPQTNGWITFFNAFNLLLGSFFLVFPLTPGMAFVHAFSASSRVPTDLLTYFYSFIVQGLTYLHVSNPVPLITIALGVIPATFSILFFLVPLFRKIRLARQNRKITEENLRKRIYAEIMANPVVDPKALRIPSEGGRPAFVSALQNRVVERFAALKKAEPVQLPDGGFAYRFAELESEIKDVEEYRKNVDMGKYQVGKVVFDSGS
jgi:hypothetical protein